MNEKRVLTKGTECELAVNGMHCPACEMTIERKLEKSPHIKTVNAVLGKEKVYLTVENDVEKEELIKEINYIIKEHGYTVTDGNTNARIDYGKLGKAFLYAVLVVAGFMLLQKLGLANILSGDKLSFPLIFMIGIVASLSSCMAVVGGLVLSLSSSYAMESDKTLPLVLFHVARLAGFFVLGGVIGYLGSFIRLGPTFYLVTSAILFVIMVVLGMNLLDVFPIFRRLQVSMPKSLAKKITDDGAVQGWYAPLVLGVLTFFLPCGFTQSMQFQAIATGSALQGALIMAVFALGTLPALALISFTSVKFAQSASASVFFKTSGFIVLFFALHNFYSALVAAGIVPPLFF